MNGRVVARAGRAFVFVAFVCSRAWGDDDDTAKGHFERSRELYAAGAYKEALRELEQARALDPSAKQLTFNIAVVDERLGRLDDALRALHEFQRLDLTRAERAKAAATIRRIEGAKHDLAAGLPRARPPDQAMEAPGPPQAPAPPSPSARPVAEEQEPDAAPPRSHAWVWTTGTAAVVLAGIGTGFAVAALHDRPTGFVTGLDGSYADLVARRAAVHREAVVADVAFGGAVLAAAVTTYLLIDSSAPRRTAVSVVPLSRGGGLALEGTL